MLRVFRRVILLVCASALLFACSGSKSVPGTPDVLCQSAADCKDGQVCQNGACVAGQDCEIEADCNAGQTCLSGICQALPVCDTSADCDAGITCVDGFCRKVSCVDGGLTCKSGTHCDRSSGQCVSDPVDSDTAETESETPTTCEQNIDCGPMMECYEGHCRAVVEIDGDGESAAENDSEQTENESDTELPSESDTDYPIDDSLLCKSCSSDAECGAPNNLCLTDQSGEFFCARFCDDANPCPAGYGCTDLPSSLVGNQCQPTNLRCLTLDGDANDLCSGGCMATAVDTCMGDSICMCAASYLRLVPCEQVCQHAGYAGADGCAYDATAQKDACTCTGTSDFCTGYVGTDSCCTNGDPCRKAGNGSCECSGFCSWDQADCTTTVDGDSSTSQTCAGYLGSDPCCKVDDPCYLGYDDVCQCNGACEWDSYDCENSADGDGTGGCSGSCYSYEDYTCVDTSTLCVCSSGSWTEKDCQAVCTAAGYGPAQGCGVSGSDTSAKCSCGMLAKTCYADTIVTSFPYQITANTSDGTNDFNASPSCFADYATMGCDKVYSVTLSAGQTLTAKLDNVATGYDPALVISAICSTVAPCLAGADAGGAGAGETLTYTAPSAGTYFVSVDSGYGTSNSQGCGAYRLSLSVSSVSVDGDLDSDTTDNDTTDRDTTDNDTTDNDTTDVDTSTPICGSYSGLFEDCCRTGNPCGWSGDQYCDCHGMCSWDSSDCTGTKGTCANPLQVLSIPYTYNGNTGNSSLSNLLGITGCESAGTKTLVQAKGPDQVFQMEGQAGHDYRIAVSGVSGWNTVLSIRSDCNDAPSSCLAIDDKTTSGEMLDITLADATNNGYIYIVVDGYGTSSKGTYTLTITDTTGTKK